MSVESLNFWLAKFVQEVMAKVNGQRYLGRSLYIMTAGLQRHIGESGNDIRQLNQAKARLVKRTCFIMSDFVSSHRI